jgi:hypothetical protein
VVVCPRSEVAVTAKLDSAKLHQRCQEDSRSRYLSIRRPHNGEVCGDSREVIKAHYLSCQGRHLGTLASRPGASHAHVLVRSLPADAL